MEDASARVLQQRWPSLAAWRRALCAPRGLATGHSGNRAGAAAASSAAAAAAAPAAATVVSPAAVAPAAAAAPPPSCVASADVPADVSALPSLYQPFTSQTKKS